MFNFNATQFKVPIGTLLKSAKDMYKEFNIAFKLNDSTSEIEIGLGSGFGLSLLLCLTLCGVLVYSIKKTGSL